MTALGETLRSERIKRNLDYDAISKELKIPPRVLQAIEEEQLDKLPAGVFVKSFVRQYARLLGLNEDEAVACYQRLAQPADAPSFSATAAPPPKVEPAFDPRLSVKPIPVEVARLEGWSSVADRGGWWRSSTLTSLALVVGVMLICSLVYGWWQRDRRFGSKPVSTASAAQPVSQPGAAQTAPATPTPVPTPAAAQPDSGAPSQTAETAPPPTPPEVSRAGGTAAPVTTAASVSSAPSPSAPGPVHIELTATEPVWVTARSDGKYAFSGMIPANQTKLLDASDSAEVKVGNAAGVKITLNGKPIGDFGGRGQVRTIQFTSGGFHIVVAPKPSDPIGLL